MDSFKKQSIYLKSLYFFLFIGIGSYLPFSSIFYKYVLVKPDGTPAIEYIRIIYFVMPLVGLISSMVAGVISDKMNLGRHIITVSCFAGGILTFLIALSGEAWIAKCTLELKFFYIFTLLIFATFFTQPIHAIIDAETMSLLNKHAHRELYGTFRLWGTYGWSVATILMGIILLYFYRLPIIFYGAGIGYFILAFVSFSGIDAKPASKAIKIPWEHLKNDRRFLMFLVYIFLVGIVSNSTFSYMGYFFDDVMKSPFEMGIIFGTWTLFEIPVMLYSHKLIKKFGNRWLIVVGMALDIIRLLLFSLFTKDVPFLYKFGAALIHGPAFGLKFIGVIDFVDRQAHEKMRATYMSITSIARMSIAAAIGGFVGGWVIKQWGGAFLMKSAGVVNILLIFFFVFVVRGHSPKEQENSDQNK